MSAEDESLMASEVAGLRRHDQTSEIPRALAAKRRIPLSWSIVSSIWILLDSAAILGCGAICYLAYVGWSEANAGIYTGAIFFVWISVLILSQIAGLTESDAVLFPHRALDKILIVGATSFLFLLALAFSLKASEQYSRVWIYLFAASSAAAVLGLRILGAFVMRCLANAGRLTRKVAVFGVGTQAERFISSYEAGTNGLSRLVGVFHDDANWSGSHVNDLRICGTMPDLVAAIRRGDVDDVVVALPWNTEGHVAEVVGQLQEHPVNIYLGFDLVAYKFRFRGAPSHFSGLNLVSVVTAPLAGWNVVLKAAEDRFLSALLLIFLSPVFLMIALAVRIESRGPILFSQTRYGFNNKEFKIYKFRTMIHAMIHTEEEMGRTIQATREDLRVTRVGRILRRASLDELPQLFNVLAGSMSLVGPRPHAVDHNEEYGKVIRGYFARHNMKPGITGLAQVNDLRGETRTVEKMEERVRQDIYYTENWSLWLDLRILAKTAYCVWFSNNAF